MRVCEYCGKDTTEKDLSYAQKMQAHYDPGTKLGDLSGYCSKCVKKILTEHALTVTIKAIPPRYKAIEYCDILEQDEAISEAVDYCKIKKNEWLSLSGKSGNGKTMLAAVVLKELTRRYCIPGAWLNMAEFSMDLRDRIGTRQSERAYISKYFNPPLLVMDDLGAGHSDTNYATGAIYVLLNRRWEDTKRTIITTNMETKNIAERLGVPIADRILRGGSCVELKGGSFALKKGRK